MAKLTVEEIIDRAVNATRIASDRTVKDTFKATEKRLYAYPIIRMKIEDDKEKMEEIKQYGVPGKSKSIVRFNTSGARLTLDEIQNALLRDMAADIARNELEIETINKSLEIIKNDPYCDIVKYKYFEGKNDDVIAEIMSCDPTTVRRNKSRLVGRLAVFLYGVNAVN